MAFQVEGVDGDSGEKSMDSRCSRSLAIFYTRIEIRLLSEEAMN